MGMAEIGQISRGTVIRVLPYGALVRLDEGTVGLVHISEIDEKFVHNVGDYLVPETRVVVKVLACKEGEKYEFSIKRAKGEVLPETPTEEFDAPDSFDKSRFDHAKDFETASGYEATETENWRPPSNRDGRAAFDEKLRDFLSDSGERISDLKRHSDAKLHRKTR